MKPKPKTCYYSETQIQQSGLLSAERFQEVQAAVTSRISPAFDRDGKPLGHAQIVHLSDGTRWIHPRADDANSKEYVRTQALADILTADELTAINDRCLEAGRVRRESERFSKAEKLTAWDGGAWLGDTYYHTMDDLLEDLIGGLENEDDPWPEYVWAASPRPVIIGLDAWEICENEVTQNGWDDMDEHDLNGLPELQAALDAFTAANATVVSYVHDFHKAVLLTGYKQKLESLA